jgi:hypothetical protein
VLDGDGSVLALGSHDAAERYQFQPAGAIETRRPVYGQFYSFAGVYCISSGEEDTATAHIDGCAHTTFTPIFSFQYRVPDLLMYGKTVGGPPLSSCLVPHGSFHTLIMKRTRFINNSTAGSFLKPLFAGTAEVPKGYD